MNNKQLLDWLLNGGTVRATICLAGRPKHAQALGYDAEATGYALGTDGETYCKIPIDLGLAEIAGDPDQYILGETRHAILAAIEHCKEGKPS